jgi:small nuclear ribonucleoprotein (snRNP)-like protein
MNIVLGEALETIYGEQKTQRRHEMMFVRGDGVILVCPLNKMQQQEI